MESILHILDFATERFFQLGIKSVSMDDIASQLGISKKTLYQHFDNKKDLVHQSISRYALLEQNLISEISHNAIDAVDEMVQIGQHTVSHFRQIKPVLIHDLKKYYRDIWNDVILFQSRFFTEKIRDNIQRGITEGLYRNQLDSDIISKLYVSKSISLVDEELFSLKEYEREKLVTQHITYHIYGILSEQGRTHFETYALSKK